MSRNAWHILREDGALTLARHLPVRFDVEAGAAFPPAGKLRLARQVRQDMWRALQSVRGFSPVVRVEEMRDGLWLRAGGRLDGRAPRGLEAAIAGLLASPAHRARWLNHAGAQRG